MEDLHAWKDSVEQHIDKRAKVADTTLVAESPSEALAMDCASIPDDGQLYYDDKFEDILVKKFQAEREKLLHTVGVEVLRWDMRRCTLTRVKSCNDALVAGELEYATSVIDENANNFHAWSHRKWVLQTFGGVYTDKIWDEELHYCDKMVDKDPFNSLVWDHRYFVVTRCLVEFHRAFGYDEEERAWEVEAFFWKKRDIEVDFAIEVIKGRGAGNQCPWSYLRSLFSVHSGFMALNCGVTSVVLWVLDKKNSTLKDLDGMEERSILNAVNMLLDLLSHGYTKCEKTLQAVEALCPDCPPQFHKIHQVMTDLEMDLTASGLVWRNGGSEFLAGTFESFQCTFKLKSNKVWRKKVVGETAPSLPAEKNAENDASACLPLPEEPKLCKVGLCFPNRRKVRRNARKVRRNALLCKVGLCFPNRRKVRRNERKVRRNALLCKVGLCFPNRRKVRRNALIQ